MVLNPNDAPEDLDVLYLCWFSYLFDVLMSALVLVCLLGAW